MRYSFAKVFLPFCLKRLGSGAYVALNRNYVPLGAGRRVPMTDEEFPYVFRFDHMTQEMASSLSRDGSPDTQCIYLYAEGTFKDDEKAAEYFEKLGRLAKYKIHIDE